jgi:LPXTG-motif cell wall-anchored protein
LQYLSASRSPFFNGFTGVEYTYNIQDGSSLDEDGTANAIIVDPVAIAGPDGSLGSLPSTGSTVWPIVSVALMLIIGGFAFVVAKRKNALS